MELDDGGHDVGDKVFANGLAPTGKTELFQAVILGKRKRYPPLKILFIKTMDGLTDNLLLPVPQTVHVPPSSVRKHVPP
jgi:hypothetical protein